MTETTTNVHFLRNALQSGIVYIPSTRIKPNKIRLSPYVLAKDRFGLNGQNPAERSCWVPLSAQWMLGYAANSSTSVGGGHLAKNKSLFKNNPELNDIVSHAGDL